MQSTRSKFLTPEEKRERERLRAEREAAMRLKNNKLGVTIFQGSWIMVFVSLIVVFWQMRYSPDWLRAGYTTPDLVLPSVATVLILLSAWLCRSALQAVSQDRVPSFMNQWRWAIVASVGFFGLMLVQFFALPSEAGQITPVYRLMIGYHALHALVIAFMMVQVYRFGQVGRYNSQNFWSVEATTRLWYFVVVAWIMFYIVLYWIP